MLNTELVLGALMFADYENKTENRRKVMNDWSAARELEIFLLNCCTLLGLFPTDASASEIRARALAYTRSENEVLAHSRE